MCSKSKHNGWYIALVIYNVLAVCSAFVLCAFSISDTSKGLFMVTQMRRSMGYQLDIGPSDWVFYVWFIVFPIQCLWQLYAVLNLFRKTRSKEPLYSTPYLLRPLLLGVYVVANGATVAWCFLFDRGYVRGALAALGLSSILLAVALVNSYQSLGDSWQSVDSQKGNGDVWCVKLVVQNGLAIYLSWCCFLTMGNLAIILTQHGGVDVEMSSTIALGVLALVIVVYTIADMCVLVHHSRYTFSFYVMMAVALSAVFMNDDLDSGDRNFIFAVVLCGASSAACLVKAIAVFILYFRDAKGRE